MILYKYASFSSARSIIESNSIGFSCLEDLNDPFECTSFGFLKNSSTVPHRTVYEAYKDRFSRNYALLSLSKNPLNSLMWAHYGNTFQGIVVGIDVDKAGFTSPETSVIPAQFGGVEYINDKKTSLGYIPDADELMNVGGESMRFEPKDSNLVKRAFLYKSSEWNYEEEIRVVKDISSNPHSYHYGEGPWKNESGHWNKIMIEGKGRPLFCYKLPKNSIVEVILGPQVYRNVVRNNILSCDEFHKLLNHWKKRFRVSIAEADVLSWKLKSKPYEFSK